MTRHLIIDGQIFQTPAWHRGMGKYSLNLLSALCEKNNQKQIWTEIDVLLSSQNKISKDALKDLKHTLPSFNIVMLHLQPNDFRNSKIANNNRATIDKYVESQIDSSKEIDYLILSLMQGEIFPTFPSNDAVHKLLLFYDLVPLMLHDVYLRSWTTRAEHLTKIAELLKTDIYFTISKTVANDLTLYLGIDNNRIINIDGGPIEHAQVKKTLKVPKPFILMPNGNDPRKNNRRGVQGFNEFNQLQEGAYTLVLTSFYTEKEREELNAICNNLHFTGNVSGEELSYLYDQSVGLLFPSEYEGLGLPILEAVEHNKPVACSNISVFNEMSKTAFYTFEPKSVLGIERALTKLVTAKKIDSKAYHDITNRYQWHNTAEVFVNTISKLAAKNIELQEKPRIAVLGPDSKEDTAASNLMQYAHAELSRLFTIDYYMPKASSSPPKRVNYLSYIAPTTELTNGVVFEPEQYEESLYHLSNKKECAEVLFAALANPGIVALYDTKLDEVWLKLKTKNLISDDRYMLEELINEKYSVKGTDFLATLLSTQKAVIVFNEAHKQLVASLASLLKLKLEIYIVKIPIGNIVYPEASPNKTIVVGELYDHQLASDNRPIETPTDFVYNETLSKIRTLIFDDKNTYSEIMEAMRFGVIPFLDNDTYTEYKLPQTVQYKTVEEARASARRLADDESKTQHLTEAMAQYAQGYSMPQFVKGITEAIKGTGS